ncbi:aspartyl-phosphate phosphatase Spo0E family protein [Clostridium botulinum]|uniref:aspartyl-phosphate phosphatase Spo0E family protein n=1 Tax=Clostridium botulinum TaxID=1491 RepID=UPI00090824A0|nr:aspartyl-phosphate phosphatase Spo0E family protein [Clostridium botulinum]MCD3351691.1 aspartyl-phosphate phosphatase Spo0E family protein [Clostridium botulinum D/C]MCD3360591.1 aspartyl-phosphate phosphatase Spo0E family protein [Clostridium botulinum D/C]MCD3363785.1 aspartyl-phosphate phosphatase Spo0E family protein [Clostridium botulinum D/C]MCD3366366.1 aspartyl-phosphate phosphatase Spo0E family protein [Clostridium botulinum D/C]QPW61749.1 aspartyl-phosphate phosphatase Spo0E fami
MSEVDEIIEKIEEMRKYLNDLINEKENLLDEEIIWASQTLDKILNDYNNFLSEK